MTILHIGKISNNPYSGVCAVVPKYLFYQNKYADVALWNLSNEHVDQINNQYSFFLYKNIKDLPKPFNKPDIIVFHEIYRIEYVSLYKQVLRCNIPYVIIPHGSLSYGAQRKKYLKKKTANFLLFNSFINSANALQLLSKFENETTLFGKNKFIETNGITSTNRKKEIFNNDNIVITYIGRLDLYYKGIDILIKAVSKISNFLTEMRVKLFIYGPDSNGELKKIKKCLINGNAEKLFSLNMGISGAEKENTLLYTDYFIQTSRSEGMPMGILEALSYGIPCIITEGTTLGDLVRKYDAGWVSKTDSESLSNTIKQAIIEKDKLPTKSKNAIRLCHEEFSWDNITKSTIEKYKSIINFYKNNK